MPAKGIWKSQHFKSFSGRLGALSRTPPRPKIFGPGCIGRPVWPILSAIFSYFSNFALQKNHIKCSVLTTFLRLDGQLGSQESTKGKSACIYWRSWSKVTFCGPLFEPLFEKNYGPASATQPKIFGPKVILPTTSSILETIFSSFGPFLIFNSQLKVSQKQDYHKSLFSNWECKKVVKTEHFG